MSQRGTGGPSHLDMLRRKHHPLVRLLSDIRRTHKVNQTTVETCMELTLDKLKHIEQGRDYLPGLQSGPSEDIGMWIQSWMRCVGVTAAERDSIEETLMNVVLGRFGDSL